jgi:phosphinothricin acetyltransferase
MNAPRNPFETFPRYPHAMESPVRIRPACEADLEAINRIYNDEILHGTATWDCEPWPMEKRRAWWEAHRDPLQPVLVAEAAGRVLGFAYLTRMSDKAGWRFTREDTIYLDPTARGRGIGRILLGALLDDARRLGIRVVFASITSTNEASIRLHTSFGFQCVGVLRNVGYKFGRWLDTAHYQLDLGEPHPGAPTW